MSAADASVSEIVAKCRAAGVVKVYASTQYGMGFLLAERSFTGNENGIVFRQDDMPHWVRSVLADKVNSALEDTP